MNTDHSQNKIAGPFASSQSAGGTTPRKRASRLELAVIASLALPPGFGSPAQGQVVLVPDESGSVNMASITFSNREMLATPPAPIKTPSLSVFYHGELKHNSYIGWLVYPGGPFGGGNALPSVADMPAVTHPSYFKFQVEGMIGPNTYRYAWADPRPPMQGANFGPGSVAVWADNAGVHRSFLNLSDDKPDQLLPGEKAPYASVIQVYARAGYQNIGADTIIRPGIGLALQGTLPAAKPNQPSPFIAVAVTCRILAATRFHPEATNLRPLVIAARPLTGAGADDSVLSGDFTSDLSGKAPNAANVGRDPNNGSSFKAAVASSQSFLMLSGETFILEFWETWVVDPGATFQMLSLPQGAPHFDFSSREDDLHPLRIVPSGNGVTLSWPRIPGAFVLESARQVSDVPAGWTAVTAPVVEGDGVYQLTLPAEAASRIFRLRAAAPAQ